MVSGEIRSCVTQKLNDEMKLIVATDQWETEAFDWPGLSEDSEHSLFRFAADIRSEVKIFICNAMKCHMNHMIEILNIDQ